MKNPEPNSDNRKEIKPDSQPSSEIQRLEERRESLLKTPTFRVGLYGVPCAGKTSFFVGLYLHRNDDVSGTRFCFDRESMAYLRRMADHFVKTGQMEATAAVSPKTIAFEMKMRNGQKVRFESRDIAGHLFEPRECADVTGIEDEARSFVSECDAILCLADCRQPAYQSEDVFDLLPDSSNVLFVPTKLDGLLESPERLLKQSRAGAKAIYESLDLNATAPLDQFFRSRWSAANYHCVPVAALGPTMLGGKLCVGLPIDTKCLRPFNLCRPWQVIVASWTKRRDQQLQDLDGQIATEHRRLQAQSAKQAQRIKEEQDLVLRKTQAAEQKQETAKRKVSDRIDRLKSRREQIESDLERWRMDPWSRLICYSRLWTISKQLSDETGDAELRNESLDNAITTLCYSGTAIACTGVICFVFWLIG